MSQTRNYKDSPFGEAVHPHFAVPDTKFNASGLFHVNLKLDTSKPDVKAFIAAIKEASEQAFKDYCEKEFGELSPKAREKKEAELSIYYPYSMEEDAEGEETGYVLVDFKQNATIRLRDGTEKKVVMAIYDAKGAEMQKDPGHGSVVRLRYAMRDIPMKSLKKVGVRLDFCAVQVRDFKPKSSGGGGGFGAVDGYEDDGEAQQGFGSAPEGNADGADY